MRALRLALARDRKGCWSRNLLCIRLRSVSGTTCFAIPNPVVVQRDLLAYFIYHGSALSSFLWAMNLVRTNYRSVAKLTDEA